MTSDYSSPIGVLSLGVDEETPTDEYDAGNIAELEKAYNELDKCGAHLKTLRREADERGGGGVF